MTVDKWRLVTRLQDCVQVRFQGVQVRFRPADGQQTSVTEWTYAHIVCVCAPMLFHRVWERIEIGTAIRRTVFRPIKDSTGALV